MEIIQLGLTPYATALKKMEELHSEVVHTPNHPGFLIVIQHPPTVTMGYRENPGDLLLTPEGLRAKNIDYFKIDRGGSVTVHEPGQCIIYPIFNIYEYKLSVRSYVNALEDAMIQTCQHFNITATRDCANPGIWVGNNKIGAVGIRILKKVTKHGIAFNINNNLQTFSFVIPCGLQAKGVTSVQKELGKNSTQINSIKFEKIAEVLTSNVFEKLNRSSAPQL